jgi:hypothetical protein
MGKKERMREERGESTRRARDLEFFFKGRGEWEASLEGSSRRAT